MRDFSTVSRLVIKIGTSTLSTDGGVNTAAIRAVAEDVTELHRSGKEIAIVTSGAIGMGAGLLGRTERVTGIRLRQACAAIGQPLIMEEYRRAFLEFQINVAQVLLTADVLSKRETYLNLRNVFETLFSLRVIPVINENDSVSTEEIGSAFGDNDRLSAYVASKIDASLLILLSDIDALYDRDPRSDPKARPIRMVPEITREIEQYAGGTGSVHASGGMKTKLEAARIASRAGCSLVLADGSVPRVIPQILSGQEIGTWFLPKKKLAQRIRWLLNSSPKGTIRVDDGALAALKRNKSLLPSGITAVEGEFECGDVVMINRSAKAVTGFSAAELRLLAGRHSSEIQTLLGAGRKDVVATPENIVFIDSGKE